MRKRWLIIIFNEVKVVKVFVFVGGIFVVCWFFLIIINVFFVLDYFYIILNVFFEVLKGKFFII